MCYGLFYQFLAIKKKRQTKDNAKSNSDIVERLRVRKMNGKVRRHLDNMKDIWILQ